MKKVLQRNPNDKRIGGVCSGLGSYFNTDPVLFRAIFLIIVCVGGSGVLLYFILWVVMPEGQKDYINANQTFEERNTPPQSDKVVNTPDNGSISMGLMLLSAGILLLVNNLVPDFNFRKFWPVILIIVGCGLMLGYKKQRTYKDNLNEPENEKPQ